MSSSDKDRPDAMKYAILGEDRSSDEEKLEKFTGKVGWSYLRPHFQSGVLYFVDPGLELKTVGAAIAADDSEKVTNWLGSGDLLKIGELHVAQWEKEEGLFEALVISPFVLCRPVA